MCNLASTENAYISRFLIGYSNNTGFIIIIIENTNVCFNLFNVIVGLATYFVLTNTSSYARGTFYVLLRLLDGKLFTA